MAEKKTLARPYAKAAFQYALSVNALDSWNAMLSNAAEMVKDSKVKKIITNPTLTRQQRADFFTKQNKLFDEQFCNFIRLTAEYDRLDLLPEVSSGYEQLRLNYSSELNVDVTSAIELEEKQKSAITDSLSKKLDKKLNLKFIIDQEIIGGLIVKTGDVVIDGSVRGQLKKLATDLMS